jgi:hypothetical protein
MRCPYCNEEMEKGIVRSRGGVYFLPDGESIPKLYTEKEFNKHNAIGLPPYVTILPKQTEYPIAFTCRKCRKIIIDF